MASRGRQVTIQFLGDSKSLVNATNSAGRSTTTLGDKLKRVGKAALIGFAGAAVLATKAAYDMAEAAVADEQAATLLARTLKATTGATKAQVASVEDWISAQGRLLGVTDDELRPALGKLLQATGSITKSQKLASLAMDVAADRHLDLQTVTLALSKAQTGSLGGLGRLGVATKNAAGETKTLAQITDDLTKKYSGAAAAAADTAAGKFKILKTQLAETGESIGYKLLPVANELGDWFLDDGIPAIQGLARAGKQELGPVLRDIRTWVGENKDEMQDLAKTITGVAIPALRTAGGVAGDALKFFMQLPGPVKSIGVEAAAAAIVLPRMTAAVNGLGTAVGLSTTKMGGWRKAMLLTAGTVGIGAITQGAQSGNKAVSLLGAAMTGAFVGGTIGSAIPVIGTAIGAVGGAAVGTGIGLVRMRRASDAAGDSAKSASPKIDGLAASLNQTTGAATRATKALILQKLQEEGLVVAAGQLGIATSDMIKATLGNHKALERVNTAWERNGNLLDGVTNQNISGWIAGMRNELYKSEKAIKDNNAALDGTDRKARKAADALKTVGKERPPTNKWQALFSGDLDKASTFATFFASNTRRTLGDGVGRARANMRPFTGDLVSQLNTAKGRANTAGVGIGNSIESGVNTGLGGIIQGVVNTVQAAINAAQAAAGGGKGKGGGGKGKGGGGKGPKRSATGSNVIAGNFGDKGGYAQALLDEYSGAGRKAEVAGNALLNSIVRGLKKGERTLKNVMDGLQSYIQTKTDKLNEILTDRSSFVEGFRSAFTESIFSAQFADADGNAVPPTLQKLMEFAQQQQANAHALAGNIQSLISKGLSRDLLSQLASQGQSGFAQIAALATGSQADIDQFNAIARDTRTTLEGLGTDLYNALNPGTESQIALLQSQVKNGTDQLEALRAIGAKLDKGDKIEIKGTDLVILFRALEKSTGKKLLATPA